MMSKPTVATQFRKLLLDIAPRPAEVARAKRQQIGIQRCLGKTYNVSRAWIFGSHVKGTAVRSFSDVDILIVLRRQDIRWGGFLISSTTLLRNIRDELRLTYSSTDIRRDAQAVAVRFGQGEHGVDVVPAVYDAPATTGHPVYLIPDGEGDWLKTSPDAQLKALNVADARYGGRLKAIIRLIKWWMFVRSPWIPLDSTHLEAALVTNGLTRKSSYSFALANAFVMLSGRRGRDIRDPIGISGVIPVASTDAQRDQVLSSLEYAVDHALRAIDAEEDSDYAEAVRQWKLVFNQYFPG